ncbi:MAG: serine/threonine-protein kinase [Myxococcota bacterium]
MGQHDQSSEPSSTPGGSTRDPESLGGERLEAATTVTGLAAPIDHLSIIQDFTQLQPGARVGRYEISEILGQGGMGRVYRAHDPVLDRDIALKLLLHYSEPRDLARLQREAMAMAQLSHPNVLPVYDIEEHQGQPVIVMELVRGQTVQQWLLMGRRRHTAILGVFIHAGWGLHAAHDAGLIHRDFKPSNIMLGDDGRVRVMDFGLARPHGPSERIPSTPDSLDLMDHDVTETHAILGTRAYMSPEQLRGATLRPTTDQYSFCVALWEALTGARPFEDSSESSSDDPPATRLPRAVRAALLRGLDLDPRRRFESMEPLLKILERAARAPRRIAWAVGASVLVGGTTAATLATAPAPPPEPESTPCSTPTERLVDLWDDTVRDRTRAAVLATGASHAPATWERVASHLDDYAMRWADSSHRTCLALQMPTPGSRPALEARARCLDARAQLLAALVTVIEQASAAQLGEAIQAAQVLPDLKACQDQRSPVDSRAPSPTLASNPAVDQAYEQLAQLRAQHELKQFEPTIEPLRALLDHTGALGYDPLTVEVRIALGRALAETSPDEALAPLERAYFDATTLHRDRAAFDAARYLAGALGISPARDVDQARYEQALTWVQHMKALADRLDDAELQSRYAVTLGYVHRRSKEYHDARAAFVRALQLDLELHPARSLPVANTASALAGVLTELSEHHLAQQYFEHALEIFETELGPQHPTLVSQLKRLGLLYQTMGSMDRARAMLGRSLAIAESANEPDPLQIADIVNGLGIVEFYDNDFVEAREQFQRSHDLREQVLGANHYSLVDSFNNLAAIDFMMKDSARGFERLKRARSIVESRYGPRHPDIASILTNLAGHHTLDGDLEAAAQAIRQALEIDEANLGPNSKDVVRNLVNLADLQSRLGEHEEAQILVRRALDRGSRALGPRNNEVAEAWEVQGQIFQRRGDHEDASDSFWRAAELYEAIFGTAHPRTLTCRGMYGIAQFDLGHFPAARPAMEQALEGLSAHDQFDRDDPVLAQLSFRLAQLSWRQRSSRARARALARSALAIYRRRPDPLDPGARDDIERWLVAHPHRTPSG